MFAIGMNNRLNQPMAHDVGFVEKLEGDSFHIAQSLDGLDEPVALVPRQVNLGSIPVTTHFES
jgi:hypothetical protein